MATQTAVYQGKGSSLRKIAWRVDAVGTLLLGDLLLFAPGKVIDIMGMSEGISARVQVMGIVLAVYGLWALWAARTGTISRLSYTVAVDVLVGFVIFLAVLVGSGVEFSTAGHVILLAIALDSAAMAWLWWGGARQSA